MLYNEPTLGLCCSQSAAMFGHKLRELPLCQPAESVLLQMRSGRAVDSKRLHYVLTEDLGDYHRGMVR